MRRYVLPLLIAAAARLDAQYPQLSWPPSAAFNDQNWTLSAAYGAVAMRSGADAGLMRNPEGVSASVRRRVGERWWVGLDVDGWFSNANQAGVDSLAARSGVPGIYTENGATFLSQALAVAVRYDAWTKGPVLGYAVASLGINGSGGYVHGLCRTLYEPCEIDPTNVPDHGTKAVGGAGVGLAVRLFDTKGFWRLLFPSHLVAEARLVNQGAHGGRLTTVPISVGFAY